MCRRYGLRWDSSALWHASYWWLYCLRGCIIENFKNLILSTGRFGMEWSGRSGMFQNLLMASPADGCNTQPTLLHQSDTPHLAGAGVIYILYCIGPNSQAAHRENSRCSRWQVRGDVSKVFINPNDLLLFSRKASTTLLCSGLYKWNSFLWKKTNFLCYFIHHTS